jgi:prepilin-type N-terminal cleavage/methylation domain-containing protein
MPGARLEMTLVAPRTIAHRRQAGFTIVEMMVAATISLILLGAAFHFFDDMESMTQSVAVMADVNQSLRGSIDLIGRDLYQAGASIPIGGVPLPNGTGASYVNRPGPAGQYFPPNNGVLSVITPGYGLSGNIDGNTSDEVTVVMVDNNWTAQSSMAINSITSASSPLTGYIVNVPASYNLASGSSYNVNAGDLLMFSTTGGLSALGLVTGVDTTGNNITLAGDALNLDQVCAAQGCAGSIDSLQTDPIGQPGVYPSGMTLTKVDMITYYLDNSNPAHPYTLMRQINAAASNAVAYGINSLQFSYDLSTGTSNVRNPDPVTPNQIRSVNMMLSAISAQKLRRSGQFFSNTMTTTVTIRNLEYVNQFP